MLKSSSLKGPQNISWFSSWFPQARHSQSVITVIQRLYQSFLLRNINILSWLWISRWTTYLGRTSVKTLLEYAAQNFAFQMIPTQPRWHPLPEPAHLPHPGFQGIPSNSCWWHRRLTTMLRPRLVKCIKGVELGNPEGGMENYSLSQ